MNIQIVIEPDVIGWGSLLASSFVHKNMDLAKVAAERLLLINPDDDDVHECMRHNDDDVHDESEEFCLVSGLKFGVENLSDYNKAKEPIPFRRRVFSSDLDGGPITGKDVELLIESDVFKKLDDNDAVSLCCVGIVQLVLLGVEDRRVVPKWILRLANDRVGWDNYPWGSYVWPKLYKNLRDANVKRWQPLYASSSTNESNTKTYSIEGFAWAFKTWILESFRAATGEYYTRYRRHPRIVAWSSKHKFYRHMLKPMLHGQLPVERLVPDEIEARSRWWVSSRAYFDGRSFEDEQIPRHLNRNNYFEVPSEMYREFEEQRRGYQEMKENNNNMYEKITRFMEDTRRVPEANTTPIIPDQQFGASGISGFQSYQGLPSAFHTLANNSSFLNMATPSNWQTPNQSNWLSPSNWQTPNPSYLGVEDRRPVPNWILRLANDRVSWDNYPWGSYVWPTLYKHLRDTNVKRWQPLYASSSTNESNTKTYSIEGFAWAFKTWILESFRAATGEYYTRYRRHPRIVAWSSKHKFYRHMLKPMLHGQLPIERLVLDEIEARSRWWVSSRAYFDGGSFEDEQIPRHLNRNNYFEVPSEMYREFEEQRRGYQEMKENNNNMYEKITRFMEDTRRVPEANTTPIIPDQQFGASDISGFQSYQNLCDRARREPQPSIYMLSPYTVLPPTTELPKKRIDKTKKKGNTKKLSPMNLGNTFADENVSGDDVTIIGVQQTDNYFNYENVDPDKVLIRERTENANWTLAKSGTVCLHQENNRFMILTEHTTPAPTNWSMISASFLPHGMMLPVVYTRQLTLLGGVHWGK
ncbi:phospholipase-like protein [Tanacetum coccineum]